MAYQAHGRTKIARTAHPRAKSSRRIERTIADGVARSLRRQHLDDLASLRESTCIRLREQKVPVDNHVKDAATALDQGRFESRRGLDLGRQTGGPWKVVSLSAVGDLDLHTRPGHYRKSDIASTHRESSKRFEEDIRIQRGVVYVSKSAA
jgi:hypothetical protein